MWVSTQDLNMLVINWIGNFQSGYVGEVGDSVHLVGELRKLGCIVKEVPQDIWKAYCDGETNPDWKDKLPMMADINIIMKWPHFDNKKYIEKLRFASDAPVFYWVWDYMYDNGMPEFHKVMVNAADLYLSNDVRSGYYLPTNAYYFPFDVADGSIKTFKEDKEYDVAFFGSWIGQGNRQEWLKEINQHIPVRVFSWNWKDWPDEFTVSPAVYGEEFNQEVSRSKIVLGFSTEPSCWGYWSNRVGKTLLAGGFLLYQYAPGMELFLRNGVEYFSTLDEVKEKIDYYLIADTERELTASLGQNIAQLRFSSAERVKDLKILIERYLKDHEWKY